MYMPDLIKDGRIYAATPPLYGVNMGTLKKKNYKYFQNKLEYVQYIQKSFTKQYLIETLSGVKLSSNDVVNLLYRNILYNIELELVADNYGLNPYLLERVLLLEDSKDFKIISKGIKETFGKKMEIEQNNSNIIIKGLIGNEVETLFLNDVILSESVYILDLIRNVNLNEIYYKVNGVIMSIYQLMKLFESSSPLSNYITRYKGLGEMNGDQLAQSTLHPDMDRTLIRYTFEDAKVEIESIKSIYNNKNKLAKSIEVNRMDLLS